MNHYFAIRFSLLFLACITAFQTASAQNQSNLIDRITVKTDQIEQRLNQIELIIDRYDRAVCRGNTQKANDLYCRLQTRMTSLATPIHRLYLRACQL